MIILALRTDSPVTELYLLHDTEITAELSIETGRELAQKLPALVADFMSQNNVELNGLDGVICFAGPGSFTGLRIGHTYANTLAYSLSAPIVQKPGDNWVLDGVGALIAGENSKVIIPQYGSEANITKPKSI